MAEGEIGFAQLGLASILKQNQLVVPPNQREYSWTVKEVRTLLQDFAKAISGGRRKLFSRDNCDNPQDRRYTGSGRWPTTTRDDRDYVVGDPRLSAVARCHDC
jgi:hypothetical protein